MRMQKTPRTERFIIRYPCGTCYTLNILTRYRLEYEVDIYKYLLFNYCARTILYINTSEANHYGQQMAFIYHDLLRFPILLTPDMDDARFCSHLIFWMNNYIYV